MAPLQFNRLFCISVKDYIWQLHSRREREKKKRERESESKEHDFSSGVWINRWQPKKREQMRKQILTLILNASSECVLSFFLSYLRGRSQNGIGRFRRMVYVCRRVFLQNFLKGGERERQLITGSSHAMETLGQLSLFPDMGSRRLSSLALTTPNVVVFESC